jgi:predicted AAA+ superfamily ATPase
MGDAVTVPFPLLTRRDAVAPRLEGKARVVIGMRRAGKTSFLHQCLADRLAEGIARDRLVYFNFEDERLGALEADQLGAIIEEYYRSFPRYRGAVRVTWCLDEIHVIPGWERFVRRKIDAENVEVLLSGSSARMLSREVATAMRGRALETVIAPFSFREFARARGETPPSSRRLTGAAEQSAWLARFDEYLAIGGFPEAGKLGAARDRVGLLQGYVDSVLFRDVAERHGVANLVALQALVRQLLRSPATALSVSKIYADFGKVREPRWLFADRGGVGGIEVARSQLTRVPNDARSAHGFEPLAGRAVNRQARAPGGVFSAGRVVGCGRAQQERNEHRGGLERFHLDQNETVLVRTHVRGGWRR